MLSLLLAGCLQGIDNFLGFFLPCIGDSALLLEVKLGMEDSLDGHLHHSEFHLPQCRGGVWDPTTAPPQNPDVKNCFFAPQGLWNKLIKMIFGM